MGKMFPPQRDLLQFQKGYKTEHLLGLKRLICSLKILHMINARESFLRIPGRGSEPLFYQSTPVLTGTHVLALS